MKNLKIRSILLNGNTTEWVKIKLKNSKDLYISSFYMPHRNINDLNKLSESITMVNNGKPKHIILAGDFNCPDIDWSNMTINPKAPEKEVQQ